MFMCVYECMLVVLTEPRKGHQNPGARDRGGVSRIDVGDGDGTQVFLESSRAPTAELSLRFQLLF